MANKHYFKFADEGLNRKLADLLKRAGIVHSIAGEGAVFYSASDREVVENDVICSIRDQVFPSWQVLTCPNDWIASYRDYLRRHEIPFQEELSDGALWFLIPRKYRPHLWKLDVPTRKKRSAASQGR